MKRAFAFVALTCALGGCGTELPATKLATQPLPYAPPPPTIADEGVACTLDVRLCADGSTVSRTGAACAFAACPAQASNHAGASAQ